jgi:nucleoside-diphosphate-sugar epimerase
MGQRVFVTGATGVLGRRVVPRLVQAGHNVTAAVRSEAKAAGVRAAGATPVLVDLFDRAAVLAAIAGHDSIAQLATNVPSGPSAGTVEAWRTHDRLRSVAAPLIADAAAEAGVARLIQESITFPYVDGGDRWIDEHHDRRYYWGNQCTVTAEDGVAGFTAAGGIGIVLRFALFMAPDSAHTHGFVAAARRGQFSVPGNLQSYVSFIHADDAAAAVVAALDAPAGTYNVAEPEPLRRAAHCAALSALAGRSDLEVPSAPPDHADDDANALARSHRISSRRLMDVTAWTPRIRCVEHWGDLP